MFSYAGIRCALRRFTVAAVLCAAVVVPATAASAAERGAGSATFLASEIDWPPAVSGSDTTVAAVDPEIDWPPAQPAA
ncbi:hypothetical protein [Streptomyces purpurogeneiscleroticus]|uniref:hypothetical protein n=1 Tax=Streptomyces purpurogeneiscleroticus TaxID=68259 RepID=UPI001CBB062B|nr:hypothetical protein [Streptomyces purpurogeneiscleroticus]MBZ4015132.1 hypothetical protein [Streptomyces purpurogeneiscleroticus]